jgi:hypothetical protein
MTSMPGEHDHDDDHIDGCDIDFAQHAEDEETAALRVLFPDGVADEEAAAFYRALAEQDV